jgi:hypothetical protein
VAVVRKETGVLNFFVNGEDQGPAATNVPERVYGVIDLYGQAAQAKENVPFCRRKQNPQIEDKKSANRCFLQSDLFGDVFSGNVTVMMHVAFCCNLYGQAAQAKENVPLFCRRQKIRKQISVLFTK